MITTAQIRDAINQLLVEKLQAETVYINRCPKDFKRPSFWLETVRRDTDDVNFSTIKVNVYFSITCFIGMDAYGNSDSMELTNVQDAVVNLFRSGYMKVGDRSLKVKANTAGYDNDRSYVDLQFEFFDDRGEIEETVPLAEEVETDLRAK